MAVDVSAEARPHCCISHLFHDVASSCPSKIAVVHAVDGARVCRSLGERSAYEADFDEKKLLSACRISQSPPGYPGDEYFTYGKILSTVEELSVRIRVVLDGGDDPALIKPSGVLLSKQLQDQQTVMLLWRFESHAFFMVQSNETVSPGFYQQYLHMSPRDENRCNKRCNALPGLLIFHHGLDPHHFESQMKSALDTYRAPQKVWLTNISLPPSVRTVIDPIKVFLRR